MKIIWDIVFIMMLNVVKRLIILLQVQKSQKTPFIFLLMGIIGLPVHKNGLLPVTMVQWRGLNVLCLHRQKLNFLHIRVLGMQPNQCGVCVNDVVV